MDKISDANKYVMPSVEDYLAMRCLLLNGIIVGLILGHEAVEKLLKATLILENLPIPRHCHNTKKLTELLIKKDSVRYAFLSNDSEFLVRLDKHYGWRYLDGNPQQRSHSISTSDLHPIDDLYIVLYENYMNLAPKEFRFRNYLTNYLFGPSIKQYTNWSELLLTENKALQNKITDWESQFNSIHSIRGISS